MTEDNRYENGWRLEDDTEIRRSLLEEDSFAEILPEPVAQPAGRPKRVSWFLKIILLFALIGISFVLGVLYSENTKLKDESTKLVDEKVALDDRVDVLDGAVVQCREELNLCAEDVDLLQDLSEYDLNPKERYGDGYHELKKLQTKRDELSGERERLQAGIEKTVSNLWRPSKQPRKFWVELKRAIREKRKLDRKLRKVEKRHDKILAEMDQAFFEKKVQFKDKIKVKNDNRRQVAAALESVPEESESVMPKIGDDPRDVEREETTAEKPKEGLASMAP